MMKAVSNQYASEGSEPPSQSETDGQSVDQEGEGSGRPLESKDVHAGGERQDIGDAPTKAESKAESKATLALKRQKEEMLVLKRKKEQKKAREDRDMLRRALKVCSPSSTSLNA